MRPDKIRDHLRAVPFRPLRIFLSDGSVHEVWHPELAFVTMHQVVLAKDVHPSGVPRQTITVDPIHVTRIEVRDSGPEGPD